MANLIVRREVLQCFKSLHQTRKQVFNGDIKALELGRLKINDEFKKNRDIKEPSKVLELIQLSKAVEKELKTTVIQAVETQPGVYEAKIRPEVVKLDNVPFQDHSA